MKYLKLFENFYSPAKQVFKSNIGNDYQNNTGNNTYPLDSFIVDEEKKAFNEGEKAFNNGVKINENPYKDQLYVNINLVNSWNNGWYNAEKNKKIKENAEIDFTGNIITPDCITIDHDDDIHIAYEKGKDAATTGYDIDDNPYISLNDEEARSLEELYYAWIDGFNEIKK